MQAALSAEAAMYRAAFTTAPTAMLVASVDCGYPGRLLLANTALCRLTGYTQGELLEASLCDLVRADPQDICPDGVDGPLADSTARHDEVRHWVHADGRELWVQSTMTPVRDPDGAVRSVIGCVQDITASREAGEALRRSEERFRLAFDVAPSALLLLDLDGKQPGRVLSVNREMRRLTGYSEAELLNMDYLSMLGAGDGSPGLPWLPPLQAGNLSRYRADSRAPHADGYTFRARVGVSLLRLDDGQPSYAVVAISDRGRPSTPTDFTSGTCD